MHCLHVVCELFTGVPQPLVEVRIVLERHGPNRPHGLRHTLGELALGLDSSMGVHHQLAKPSALQACYYNLYGRPLLRHEQYLFPDGVQGDDEIGDGLGLAGPWRSPDDDRFPASRPVDGPVPV